MRLGAGVCYVITFLAELVAVLLVVREAKGLRECYASGRSTTTRST